MGPALVIENRAGAGGIVGSDVVAKSPPDGYTLLVTYAGSQAINQSLYPKSRSTRSRISRPSRRWRRSPFFLIVNPNVPAKTLGEFIALAKAKPDEITYASSGNGSVNHLLGEMLKSETGIQIVTSLQGRRAPITDVIGGQVASAFSSLPSVLQHVQAGSVRAIAVSSKARNAGGARRRLDRRGGVPGFDVNPLVGHLGARRPSRRDRPEDQCRCRRASADEGAPRLPQDPGRRPARDDAASVRQDARGRRRLLGEGRQSLRRPYRLRGFPGRKLRSKQKRGGLR